MADPQTTGAEAPPGQAPRSSLLVLASASPRRAELLGRVVADFEVDAAGIDESPVGSELVSEYVSRLAVAKATAVAASWPDSFVLGADTTVVLGGEILGKPLDGRDARRTLGRLSGRTHQVLTGVAVVSPGRNSREAGVPVLVESTEVTFGDLTEAEIAAYVATGEPMGKAGAYAIQGLGATLVESIAGDPTAVVGLPLRATAHVLTSAGLPVGPVPSRSV